MAPTIQIDNAGGELQKGAPITLTLTDPVDGIDINTLIVSVQIHTEPFVVVINTGLRRNRDWNSPFTVVGTDEYRVLVTPNRFATWRDGQTINLSVSVNSNVGSPANAQATFTASPAGMTFSTYRFIHGSIRRKDEE